jgi:hypothetical protein
LLGSENFTKEGYGWHRTPLELVKVFGGEDFRRSGFTQMGTVGGELREEVLSFFESYVDLICEVLQRGFNVWNFDKKKLATCILLFAKGAIFEGGSGYSERFREIAVEKMEVEQIRHCLSAINQFVARGKVVTGSESDVCGT